jgi:hypothetical protein
MMNILSWDESALYSNEIDEDMGNRKDKGDEGTDVDGII